MEWVAEVLHFWFDALTPKDWFSGSADVDELIRARFAALRERVKADPPAADALDADGFLAMILVCDQFSRNLFRGRAEAFATDALALDYATHAHARGLDAGMASAHRHFLAMPFMHAEDLASQDRSVALFTGLGDADLLGYALAHRDLIARFGRFPARNAALGRASTPQERDYLDELKKAPL